MIRYLLLTILVYVSQLASALIHFIDVFVSIICDWLKWAMLINVAIFYFKNRINQIPLVLVSAAICFIIPYLIEGIVVILMNLEYYLKKVRNNLV